MIVVGNALSLPFADKTVQCCVTSPPYYGLRDYGVKGQIGLEKTPQEYVNNLVLVFREVRRVLKNDGTIWINLGDSYATSSPNGSGYGEISRTAGVGNSQRGVQLRCGNFPGIKPKDLIGIPWMVAFALRADGWYLRSDIIWNKPNPMPESVKDRPTKAHEYLFLLSKSSKYYYDAEAIQEPSSWSGDPRTGYGRLHYRGKRQGEEGTGNENEVLITENKNKRSVWTINTQPCKDAHFAVMPEKLVEPCVMAGSKPGDYILDPFSGAGTVEVVSQKLGRKFVGTELNIKYAIIHRKRIMATPNSLF